MPRSEVDSPCPLNRDEQNLGGRANPATQAAAHCYQLHDTLRMMLGVVHGGSDAAWQNACVMMKQQLDTAAKASTRRLGG